ncbi:hypothetical protein QBZ16_002547 [Prototheca wickerhamii]|uniref:Uncharacterized protein n=1 Tax=Prototheca wickerhamii TaxID=3111 RepID=A0AAD9IDT6_PROWI|nr:hypothetical protein QBZ16_002547 [Prototheca wickerhamii]
MTLAFTRFPTEGASVYVGEATSDDPTNILYESSFVIPPNSDVTPIVYVGYADDVSTRKEVTESVAVRVTAAEANVRNGVAYAKGSVSSLQPSRRYTLIMTCNTPTKVVWSKDFVAGGATQAFNYAAAPATCTSTRYIIVKTSDGLQGGYKTAPTT